MIKLMLAAAIFCVATAVKAEPPFSGTIFIDPDIITENDPTTYLSQTFEGQAERTMYDRRNDWITDTPFLFNAVFSDGLTIEIQVNSEFASVESASAESEKYAPIIGRLPKALRKDVETVWIHKDVQPFGGGNQNLLIHVGQGELYIQDGILEETLVHEAAHTSLDPYYAESSGWTAAQEADGEFISTYAQDYPEREDIAESFLPYLAVKYKSDRISEALYNTITNTIPNRIAYFDTLNLDLTLMGSQIDTDNDGLIDELDTDDDNDTLSDKFELAVGRDPLMADYKLSSGGVYHSCALHDGGVSCWGVNGTEEHTNKGQIEVPHLLNPVDVQTRGYFSCALLGSGAIRCWGNYASDRTPPGDEYKAMAVGSYHVCAIDEASELQCSGVNDYGQTDPPALTSPRQVTAGAHFSCALDDSGVVCWGRNNYGQTSIPKLTNPKKFFSGSENACALDDNGYTCWGRDDSEQSTIPSDLTHIGSLSLSTHYACAIDGTRVKCWGSGRQTENIPDLSNPVQVSAGELASCALDDNGISCWGEAERTGESNVPGLFFGDEDLDGAKDDVDAVTTKVSFDDQNFTVEIKAKQEADNPVDWIDFRLGPKGSSCFIEKRVTEEDSDYVDFYVGKAIWSIGGNYRSGQYGVISDTPRIKLQDGTETYDQSKYFIHLDNNGAVSPTYSLISSTLTKSVDNTVTSEVVVSGFGEDGFLLAYPGSSSDAYKASVHLKDGDSYAGVTLDPSKVEKIDDDAYKLTTTHTISNSEDYANPRIQSISLCDASMNGKEWNTDTDQDGIIDGIDAFPLDASETLDTDSDGIGNNADVDDDGDGFNDAQEAVDGTDPLSKFSCATGCFSFDIDNSTSLAALTDGLLVIRHLFGFTGDTLIASATDTSAIRNSAADISAYLTAAESELDIDGSGDVTALTDGLLLIRYLFGFSGDSLISGAVGTSATRTTSTEIEAYIKARVPSG